MITKDGYLPNFEVSREKCKSELYEYAFGIQAAAIVQCYRWTF